MYVGFEPLTSKRAAFFERSGSGCEAGRAAASFAGVRTPYAPPYTNYPFRHRLSGFAVDSMLIGTIFAYFICFGKTVVHLTLTAERIGEARHSDYDYVYTDGKKIELSVLSLTEKGQAVLEEYEDAKHNQAMMKTSLSVAIIAMMAAIASAITTILTLVYK